MSEKIEMMDRRLTFSTGVKRTWLLGTDQDELPKALKAATYRIRSIIDYALATHTCTCLEFIDDVRL